jgi:hypothetical protein
MENTMYETTMTYHAIEIDFRNTLGQRVIVMTCPVIQTSVAVVNADACTCGHGI